MKYNDLVKKLVTKGTSLKKARKPTEPLHLKLSKKEFEELQQDILVNHKDMHDYYKPQSTERLGEYLIKHTDTDVQGILTIE